MPVETSPTSANGISAPLSLAPSVAHARAELVRRGVIERTGLDDDAVDVPGLPDRDQLVEAVAQHACRLAVERVAGAAEHAGRRVDVGVALGLGRDHPAGEPRVVADRARPAAPAPVPELLLDELVAVEAERQVHLEVLDRLVADVGREAVDRVHAVLARAA